MIDTVAVRRSPEIIAVVDDATELAGLLAVLAAALSAADDFGPALRDGLAGLAMQAEALAGGIVERL